MHFTKTYEELLSNLPPELRSNAFEYRKLKKLINKTVSELDSVGLVPSVLQSLRELRSDESQETRAHDDSEDKHPRFEYEIVLNSTQPEPRLRLTSGDLPEDHSSSTQPIYHLDLPIPGQLFNNITIALLHSSITANDDHDLIIPLPSDTAFLQLLTATLSSQSSQFGTLVDKFNATLADLAASISLTALPSSSDWQSFSAYSVIANNAMTLKPRQVGKSDLCTWREIFRIYAEAQVFESVCESKDSERGIQDVEAQLKLFEHHIQGKKAMLVLPASRGALDAFLNLNMFILGVKKLQFANVEATRKILKKHAKRTTLSIPLHILERDVSGLVPIQRASKSLPRLLVQAIGEVLLRVIPHIDDYACLICTYVAFKPIRLTCGHFFCVRCLAKLQRRGVSSCPLCRAPTVLIANPSNLDYGLLNFIADWFPLESLEKMHVDHREIHREQLEVLGISEAHVCRIM